MKKERIIKLIEQIKKYDLINNFKSPEDFDKWLSSLNNKQINNFNSLTIEPSLILFPKHLLINEDLLECDNYLKRIEVMLKLKNGVENDSICNKEFLNSKHYYKDMELLSKVPTIRYALRALNDSAFINSPYHDEDLNLIIKASNHPKEKEDYFHDSIVSQALVEVARNTASINSPYHQEDMKLISNCESEVLQSVHSYPYDSVNTLAIDEVSLKDKYHLENMQILAQNPISIRYLYKLMTNEEIINGKYYREEINAMVNAKSKITARAIYNYIVNPRKQYDYDIGDDWIDFNIDYNMNYSYMSMYRTDNIKGLLTPRYLENLKLLNEIDEKIVLFYESLLSNKNILTSKYYEHDLKSILQINNEEIFFDVYRTILDENFINSQHHIIDLEIISNTKDKDARKWLTAKATHEYSINSPNHRYDMEYISKLDFKILSSEQRDLIHHYLFIRSGINHPCHVEILENILKGEPIKDYNIVSNYLEELQDQLSNTDTEVNLISDNESKNKVLSKIRKIFNKR